MCVDFPAGKYVELVQYMYRVGIVWCTNTAGSITTFSPLVMIFFLYMHNLLELFTPFASIQSNDGDIQAKHIFSRKRVEEKEGRGDTIGFDLVVCLNEKLSHNAESA